MTARTPGRVHVGESLDDLRAESGQRLAIFNGQGIDCVQDDANAAFTASAWNFADAGGIEALEGLLYASDAAPSFESFRAAPAIDKARAALKAARGE